MKNHLKQYFIVFFSCGLAACAATPQEPVAESDVDIGRGSDCISEGTVRNYEVLDDANLIVTAGARRQYHVKLVRRAMNLRHSWSIGFSSPTSRICPSFSELLVDDSFGPERIRIQSIQRLTDEQVKDLRYLYGKGDARPEEPPPPEPVDGAEVEELG